LGKGRNHTDSDHVSMVAAEPLKYLFWPKIRFSFCSLVRIFGTSLAQIFCMPSSKVKISWTVWRFKFNTLLIILTVERRSDLTRSLTLFTFSSVFDVQGLPERGSSSTLSRPSKNALCHLKPVSLIEHALHKPFLIFRKFLLRFH